MINIVTALAEEARPLIDYFYLKRDHYCHPYPVYSNKDIRLIVSGIGAMPAAAATGFLAAYGNASSAESWINIGIAGNRQRDIGSGILAIKITDAGSGKSFYPSMLKDIKCQPAEVITVDQPVNDYQPGLVYDMEAAGFYATATRFSTVELIQCCKIISDNESSPLQAFDKKQAGDLIAGQLPFISQLCEALRQLENSGIQPVPELYQNLIHRYHFTASQKARLKVLFNQWAALTGHQSNLVPECFDQLDESRSAKELIRKFENEMQQLPVHYGGVS